MGERTIKLRILHSLGLVLVLGLTGCAGSAESISESTPAEPTRTQSGLLSHSDLSRSQGQITEHRITRSDGTEAVCFVFQNIGQRSAAGGLDCPEWAQPKNSKREQPN